jgi:hypothetical protein
MKVEELFERVGTNILVVDVQPAYRHHCDRIARKVCNLLNQQMGKKVVMWNGEDYTNDTIEDVQQYYIDKGLNPELIENGSIKFMEKQYAFFRDWMDNGISDHIIIKVIRAMVAQRVNSSEDLDLSEVLWDDELEQVDDLEGGSIYLPYLVNVNELKQLSPFYMCGGGRNECLREIELICNAFNIRYKRIDSLIYG